MISFHNQGKPRCLWTNSQEFKLGGHLRRELPGATESTTTRSTLKAVWESWSSWTFNKDSQGRFKHIWDYSAKPLIQLGYQIAKPKLRDLVPPGLYSLRCNLTTLNRVILSFTAARKETRLAPIPPPLHSNILPAPAQILVWGGSRAWCPPNKFMAEVGGGGSVHMLLPVDHARARVCNMYSQ